jgi:hypothetical protein
MFTGPFRPNVRPLSRGWVEPIGRAKHWLDRGQASRDLRSLWNPAWASHGRDQDEDGAEAPLAKLVWLRGPAAQPAGTLLSRFVRLPALISVLELADDDLHRDPDGLGRPRRRGLGTHHRRRRGCRRHDLGGRGDGSGTEEQPRAQGPQDEAGGEGSQQGPRRNRLSRMPDDPGPSRTGKFHPGGVGRGRPGTYRPAEPQSGRGRPPLHFPTQCLRYALFGAWGRRPARGFTGSLPAVSLAANSHEWTIDLLTSASSSRKIRHCCRQAIFRGEGTMLSST